VDWGNDVVVPGESRDYPGEPEGNLGVNPQLVSGGAVLERRTGGGAAGLNVVFEWQSMEVTEATGVR
jgi:hypothetical protein